MIEAINRPSGLSRIVQMSASLDERLAVAREPGSTGPQSDEPTSRFALWRQTVAPSSPADFARRLGWDALHDDAARALVTPSGGIDVAVAATPTWAKTFRLAYGSNTEELAAAFAALPELPADRALDPGDPIPFETLFLPLIAWARREVGLRAGERGAMLSATAHAALERQLLTRLSFICERALYTQFSVFRQMGRWNAAAGAFGGVAGPSRTLFDEFLRQMTGGELFAFFERYTVAARLCGTVTELWADATSELMERLTADLPCLCTEFNGGAPLGRVAALRVGQGDAHDGGRGVAIVEFEAGLRIVYKPRPLVLEGLYAELVDWLNGCEGIAVGLQCARRLERATHGWVEYIEHQPCETPEDVRRFYHRTGMALALVYGVNGTDFHFENLIARGSHPILIDMEALLSHALAIEGSVNDRSLGSVREATERVRSSVGRTGLLPVLKLSNDGRHAVNMGGLATCENAAGLMNVACWRHVNTDLMKLATRPSLPLPTANVPELDGRPRYATEYVDEIVAGFRQVYGILLAKRGELLGRHGLLSGWRARPVRFLFRHSSLYGAALARTVDPKYLIDGGMRLIQLDALAKPLLALGERPELPRLLAAERQALERMDIPIFAADSDSRALRLPSGERVEGFFERSALEQAEARLAGLDETDLAFQVEMIRMSVHACAARGLQAGPHGAGKGELRDETPQSAIGALGSNELLALAIDEAVRVAELVETRAIGTIGDRAWIGIRSLPRAQRYTVGPLDHGMFDGYTGISFFLAALHRASGVDRYRDAARSTLVPLRVRIAELSHAASPRAVEIGAGTGCASAIYALVQMAEFLDEPALLNEAGALAALVTPATTSDSTLDVLTGSAGAILGLLPLYRTTLDESVLERAVLCGHSLCERWEADAGLDASLPRGTAGIALALYRLHRQTGIAAFRQGADAALGRSEQAFAGARAADGGLATEWARGLVGLAFAQLAAPDGDGRVEATLRLIDAEPPAGLDSLGCGTMGHADLLASVALRRGMPDLLQRGRDMAAQARNRAIATSGYRLGWGRGYEHLGLFQGSPGVAYGHLRLAAPEQFPSVLDWQADIPAATLHRSFGTTAPAETPT